MCWVFWLKTVWNQRVGGKLQTQTITGEKFCSISSWKVFWLVCWMLTNAKLFKDLLNYSSVSSVWPPASCYQVFSNGAFSKVFVMSSLRSLINAKLFNNRRSYSSVSSVWPLASCYYSMLFMMSDLRSLVGAQSQLFVVKSSAIVSKCFFTPLLPKLENLRP